MFLLIYDALEAVQYTWAILDLTILAQYILHDDEILRYMEHVLYRLEKTKIVFEYHWPINSKLCQPTFNYPKCHAISYFVLCIKDYDNVVNYDTAHSKMAHKYFCKAFYNKTNKKEYDLQIWHHNVCYTNIIAMKDIISEKKVKEKEKLLENIADTNALAEVAWKLNPVNLAWKYIWTISNVDLDAAIKLGLTGIKKY